MKIINVTTNILKRNEEMLVENKQLLREHNIFMLNLMSGPGAGKTTFLEKLLLYLKKDFAVAVIEGDLYTDKDAARIEQIGVSVIQINTQGACHLDAGMIGNALQHLSLEKLDVIIIENVGNLVCPAEFEVGENLKIMIMSVTEGNDKPLKYPLMYEKSSAVILNKIDLLPYVDFNVPLFYEDVGKINEKASVFEVAAAKNIGIDECYRWIKQQILSFKEGK